MTPPVPTILTATFPALAVAAQAALDAWEQDSEGWDAHLGTGGACGEVADALSTVLAQAGIDAGITGTDFDGGHAFVHALIDGHVWSVDIPAHVYETGYGYAWAKKHGVRITPDHITTGWVMAGIDPADFSQWLEG